MSRIPPLIPRTGASVVGLRRKFNNYFLLNHNILAGNSIFQERQIVNRGNQHTLRIEFLLPQSPKPWKRSHRERGSRRHT